MLYSARAPSYECRTVLHAYMTDRELYTYYMQQGLGVCSIYAAFGYGTYIEEWKMY